MTVELHKDDLPPGRTSATPSPSTPRRWGSIPIATGSASCSSHAATAMPSSCSSPALRGAELKRLLADESVLKIFHFARFDMAVLKHSFGVMPQPVYCTKIASRLARTFTDRHGLKDLVQELLGIELSKQQQSSDWGADQLTPEQLKYAASDVLHLHALREKLEACWCARAERAWRAPVSPSCRPGSSSICKAGQRSIPLPISGRKGRQAPPARPGGRNVIKVLRLIRLGAGRTGSEEHP